MVEDPLISLGGVHRCLRTVIEGVLQSSSYVSGKILDANPV